MGSNFTKKNYTLQTTTSKCVTLHNGLIISTENVHTGASYTMYNGKTSCFYASNDMKYNPIITNMQKCSKCLQYVSIEDEDDEFSVSLPPECVIGVNEILSQLGNIINVIVIIKDEHQNSIIYTDNNYNYIKSHLRLIFMDVTIFVNIAGLPITIKRSYRLNTKDRYERQLYAIMNAIVSDYLPFVKLPCHDASFLDHEIILPSGKGGILFHESIGHILEADHFYSTSNVLANYWHKVIADSSLTISDSCNPNDMVHYNYASDGSILKSVDLVKSGIVEGLLSDSKTSLAFGIPDTGNGRASSYDQIAIPRMRNTYLHNGNYSKKEILRSTENGIFAIDIGGGQVDIERGDFVFNILSGIQVRNGEPIAFIKPFLYTGNIMSILNRIDMIGNDLSFCFAMCGKKGQIVPVSYGQPTIRISRLKSTGGT